MLSFVRAAWAAVVTLFLVTAVVPAPPAWAVCCTITVTSSPAGAGTLTGGGNHISGSSDTVTATANHDFIFTNWTVNGQVVSTSASDTFTVSGNTSLVANFLAGYTLATSASPSGGGTVGGNSGTYTVGDTLVVTATANPGYGFVNWTSGSTVVSTQSTYSFIINADTTLVANFAPAVTLAVSASPSAGGAVAGGGSFATGTSQTVTATANAGYYFLNWTSGSSVVSTSPSYTFTLSGNTALVANFGALLSAGPYGQQLPILSGTDSACSATGGGNAVAISADGNTMVTTQQVASCGVAYSGVAFVFVRHNETWTQQASLVATEVVTGMRLGSDANSVAISADGNTVIVGAYEYNNTGITTSPGASFVFSRSGTTWTEQAMLVGSNASNDAMQGFSVALSGDGNTALIGGPNDGITVSGSNQSGNPVGAAWVFTRSNGTWTQQGAKLVGSGYTVSPCGSYPALGRAVALSGDGNTAMIGGPGNCNSAVAFTGTGAIWAFTRSNGAWTQQSIFYSSDAYADQVGYYLALSTDGSTLVAGSNRDGPGYNGGEVLIFTQGGGTWSQQAALETGATMPIVNVGVTQNGNIAVAYTDGNTQGAWVFTRTSSTWNSGTLLTVQGCADDGVGGVAMSGDGNTIVVGTTCANNYVFVTPLSRANRTNVHDFNNDSRSDILWRNTEGDSTVWFMAPGSGIQGSESLGNIPTAWSVAGVRDFNGDGTSDILWRNTEGDTVMWFMNNGNVASGTNIGNIPTAWSVVGTGDFNGDGYGDILWHDTGGDTTEWFMNGGTITGSTGLGAVPTIWSVAGTGDFNADGTTDILWHDIYGDVSLWLMSNGSIMKGVGFGNVATNWSIVGTGDFNGDGLADVLWRDTAGDVMIWLTGLSNSTSPPTPVVSQQSVLGNVATTWSIAGTGDFNGDGKSDILWVDTSGNVMIWFMNGLNIAGTTNLGNVGTAWSVQGANAD